MNTISDILMDIDRGCLANNMIEDCFTYRIVYFVNEGNNGKKYYLDSSYRDLWKSLESIIRGNLTLTNNVVIAETTVLMLSVKLDAPAPCRLDAPDLDLICYASADCLHQHLQVI